MSSYDLKCPSASAWSMLACALEVNMPVEQSFEAFEDILTVGGDKLREENARLRSGSSFAFEIALSPHGNGGYSFDNPQE